MNKLAIVTGASSGIGLELAKYCKSKWPGRFGRQPRRFLRR